MSLGDFGATFLPYCLQRQADGRYIVLNREYKPLGFWTGDHIDYDAHPIQVRLPGLRANIASKVSWKGNADTNVIYLYNDSCIPTGSKQAMDAYLERLRRLMPLKVKGIVPRSKR